MHGTIQVSIRSPHRSKGRRVRWTTAPLTEARGFSTLGAKFQSAPLTEARGDVISHNRPMNDMFQSASPSKGRLWAADCFNPLPSPKQGETYLYESIHRHHDLLPRFQSAPLTEARGDPDMPATGNVQFQSAPLTEARGDAVDVFQSAPLTEARGDHAPTPAMRQWFQSAPLTEARGDYWRGFSIRSPHRSKGRHTSSGVRSKRQSAPVAGFEGPSFQSAPLTEARGDRALAAEAWSRIATIVSIRSPHRSKGRRWSL